ncbi:MAG: methionyl-tRNA formyltransferase [Candidatus Margulisiibacteriota bacterium]|nr:methionyl-tRNA formyltransferase [Candidatus Margulisiibacteriota bacterium]
MGKGSIVIATIKSWNIDYANKIGGQIGYDVFVVSEKSMLSKEYLEKINPKYIFFPHWSWKIPNEVYNHWECILFHMTDLPFGRGGSPLQNLIQRGIRNTKISAIKVVEELDAGPVYLKKELDLAGSAGEIYRRASKTIFEEMIPQIIEHSPAPKKQVGEVTIFKRRKPEESSIAALNSLMEIYDHIRMLDAEGYPAAFLKNKNVKIEFSQAKFKDHYIDAKVKISLAGEDNE